MRTIRANPENFWENSVLAENGSFCLLYSTSWVIWSAKYTISDKIIYAFKKFCKPHWTTSLENCPRKLSWAETITEYTHQWISRKCSTQSDFFVFQNYVKKTEFRAKLCWNVLICLDWTIFVELNLNWWN